MATLTLPGADIRGYYQRLGIHLPAQARLEASVRCFADPGAHRREDRNPSCSVNMVSGAWKCHACGARGGAYDAAWRTGYTPRAAIDLMIAYGLTERRSRLQTARELLDASARPSHTVARPRARTRAREDRRRTSPAARDRAGHRSLADRSLPPPFPARDPRPRTRMAQRDDPRPRARARPRPDHNPDPRRPRRTARPAALPAKARRPSQNARRARQPDRAHPPPRRRDLRNGSCSSKGPPT